MKQRQQIQDRTEKEAMLTDIGAMFHDFDKTAPKVARLTEQSEQIAKVRAESTWFYKMCILEDDALAAAHFLQTRMKRDDGEDDDEDENDDDDADDEADEKKDQNNSSNSDHLVDDDIILGNDLVENKPRKNNKKNNNNSSKYPPPIPTDSIFWLPAKHTPSSEQALRNQLLRAVQRFESFTDEVKEFLMNLKVKRQAELTSTLAATDAALGIGRHYHQNRQQNEVEGALFSSPQELEDSEKRKKELEDDENEIEDEFENAEEEDPTMMM
jgi:hypothetical protein